MFITAALTENTQRCYEIYSKLLPICAVATAVKATCKCWCRALGVVHILIPNFLLFYYIILYYIIKLDFFIRMIFLKIVATIYCDNDKESSHILCEECVQFFLLNAVT
jgi:hypothetical protein